MEKFATAFVTYGAVIATIYGIGQKADEVLTRTAASKLVRGRSHSLANAIRNITPTTISIVDLLLKYQRRRVVWVPNFVRSVAFSVLMLLILIYPLNASLGNAVFIELAADQIFESFRKLENGINRSDDIYALAIIGSPLINILIDYLSFIKTRTLLELFKRRKFPNREFLTVSSDLLLSMVICITVVWLGHVVLIAMIGDFRLEYLWLGGLDPLNDEFFIFLYILPILVVGFFTSLGIATISIFIAIIETAYAVIRRLNNARLWAMLDFKKKPMRASATVVIIFFTIAYWPVVALLSLT